MSAASVGAGSPGAGHVAAGAVLEDGVAAIASSVAGVAALHGGEFGEIATYLPGRKIVGVRVTDDLCDIHITAAYPSDVRAVARGVQKAVEPHVAVPVSVTVEDVALPTRGSLQ